MNGMSFEGMFSERSETKYFNLALLLFGSSGIYPQSILKLASLGNIDLLKIQKTAFFMQPQLPASALLKCYDRAIVQRENINE